MGIIGRVSPRSTPKIMSHLSRRKNQFYATFQQNFKPIPPEKDKNKTQSLFSPILSNNRHVFSLKLAIPHLSHQ
jgi:hypothetical protein